MPNPAQHGAQRSAAPVASLATIDRRTFVPSEETWAWLHSLPLPPGCTAQPVPSTPEDWALVEQYRLLVHGLTVLGEYERERRRRQEAGEDPFAREWDPRTCDNPAVISAVESLFKDVFPSAAPLDLAAPLPPGSHEANAAYLGALSAVQAGLGGSAAGVLRQRGTSPAPSSSSFTSSRAPPSSHTTSATTHDYSTSFRLDPATGDMIASLPLSLADLASLPEHALDPSQIPADGILADHLPLDLTGPASLPSLMGAIAELEQCVARLSLEASEARTLQKTLRQEMAARSGAPGGNTAGAGAKKKKKKAKRGKKAGGLVPLTTAAAPGHEDGSHEPAQLAMTRDEALVSGLSGRVDDCCSECGESHAAAAGPPPHHAGAAASAPSEGGLGVSAWEDGELMKALQSVSQLDRRADEYRERLRVLKEQIHHHATLVSPSGIPGEAAVEGLWPIDAEGDIYEIDEEEEEEVEELVELPVQRSGGPFGSNTSDAGLQFVSLDEHRRKLAAEAGQA